MILHIIELLVALAVTWTRSEASFRFGCDESEVMGRQRLQLAIGPPQGGRGYAPDPIWKNEKNPAIEIKFPISLSIASMPEDKRSAR